ncbi:hypothetical protein KO494_00765 [Lacinutrix sp. C3R15]|uniref:hypothetical protein n=1 Tax=Flavobacteriaceae TaxID=49546 RepID=UPI001C0A269F|nr:MULTISPECIES: hypothetical protein [Flavobacteriaceae]MBU2938057.1 hypothetical protein [Lacinutrix sp. C3R15]MDO6621371.1 hypothetical protein [Oceanihabitans sp. 1_MG-2023]
MMKRIVLLVTICLSISLFSCGEKEKKAKTEVTTTDPVMEAPKEESVFKINLDIVVPNDDEIEVFYLDYDNQAYSYKTKVTKKVTGDTKSQNIELLLPKEIFPTSLRFDFGTKNSTENIVFNTVKMSYEDFELQLNSQEFLSFFVPNEYVNYTKETGVIERKMVDGKYDPYFNSKPVFKKKLELEAR